MFGKSFDLISSLSRIPDALDKLIHQLEQGREILEQTKHWMSRLRTVFWGDMSDETQTLYSNLEGKAELLEEWTTVMGEFAAGKEASELSPRVASKLEQKGEHESREPLFDSYNGFVRDFNESLQGVHAEELDALRDGLIAEGTSLMDELEDEASKSAAEHISAKFTEEEKKEIIAFADHIWEEIFPPSYTDEYAKWALSQEGLTDNQRILLAPVNGVESIFTGLWDLTKYSTYEELWSSIQTLYGMSYEDYCACFQVLKLLYRHYDPEAKDFVAPAISFIVGSAFMVGGVSKLQKLAKGVAIPKALAPLLTTASRSAKKSQSLVRAKDMPRQLVEEIDYEHLLEKLK